AALHIAAVLAGDFAIGLEPTRSRAKTDRRNANAAARGGRERVVHLDVAQLVRPEEQRAARCARASEIVVAGTLDHEAQPMPPGEVDRRRDVGGAFDRNRPRAWRRRPGIEPAQRLGAARLVLDPIWIAQLVDRGGAVTALRIDDAGIEGKSRPQKPTVNSLAERAPFAFAGPTW